MYFKLFFLVVFTFAAGLSWSADAARVVFVAGDVSVAGLPAVTGQTVGEGQSLTTGSNGYLYLETLDKGFFILRPNSTGQIVTYQIDTRNPANSRIKLELRNGVARHISGDAVKAARHNFRFNTPVAAVGVRGTDFTAFASQDTTRIAVLSGGVIVSPFAGACVTGGFGPCDGPASRELFANKTSQVLEINRGQPPMLIQGVDQAPDTLVPPRPDEPAGLKTSARTAPVVNNAVSATGSKLDALKSSLVNQFASQAASQPESQPISRPVTQAPPVEVLPPTSSPAPPEAPPPGPPQLIWGRWQAVLDQTIEVDMAVLQASNQLVATNAYYAIMRNRDTTWQPPAQATLGFALQQSQAVIFDESSRQASPAQIENGQLQLDFAKSTFFTRFDLVNQSERFVLQNQGEVSTDGKLYGGAQFLRPNNMNVRGALANDNLSAAYLFQSRLDERRLASGVTLWGK